MIQSQNNSQKLNNMFLNKDSYSNYLVIFSTTSTPSTIITPSLSSSSSSSSKSNLNTSSSNLIKSHLILQKGYLSCKTYLTHNNKLVGFFSIIS